MASLQCGDTVTACAFFPPPITPPASTKENIKEEDGFDVRQSGGKDKRVSSISVVFTTHMQLLFRNERRKVYGVHQLHHDWGHYFGPLIVPVPTVRIFFVIPHPRGACGHHTRMGVRFVSGALVKGWRRRARGCGAPLLTPLLHTPTREEEVQRPPPPMVVLRYGKCPFSSLLWDADGITTLILLYGGRYSTSTVVPWWSPVGRHPAVAHGNTCRIQSAWSTTTPFPPVRSSQPTSAVGGRNRRGGLKGRRRGRGGKGMTQDGGDGALPHIGMEMGGIGERTILDIDIGTPAWVFHHRRGWRKTNKNGEKFFQILRGAKTPAIGEILNGVGVRRWHGRGHQRRKSGRRMEAISGRMGRTCRWCLHLLLPPVQERPRIRLGLTPLWPSRASPMTSRATTTLTIPLTGSMPWRVSSAPFTWPWTNRMGMAVVESVVFLLFRPPLSFLYSGRSTE